MKHKVWWIAVPIAIVLGGVVAMQRMAAPDVAVIHAAQRDVTRTLAVTGQVEAISKTTVASDIANVQARRVLVDKGSQVTLGQPLIELDDRELKAAAEQAAAQVRQSEANLLKAKAQLAGSIRGVALAEQAVYDNTDLKNQRDQAQANFKAAQERLVQAQENATRTREGAREQAVRAAQAQLRQAEAQARLAVANLKRSEMLVHSGAIAQADYDVAKANDENAKEAVIAAKEQVTQLAEPRTEDVRQADAAVREAEATLSGAQMALNNARLAYKNRTASRQALTVARTDKMTMEAGIAVAEADLHRAQAANSQAQTQLSKTILRAPVTGVVTDRNVEPGQTVMAGVALLSLVEPRNLRVRCDVDESNLHDLKIGQRALIAPSAFPDLRLNGHVGEIVPAANGDRGTVEIRVAIDTPDNKLLPQLTADVNIVTGAYPGALTLPREAVLDSQNKPHIRVVESGKVVEREIRMKEGDAGNVVVLQGLRADDDVIVNPNAVKVGQKVRATKTKDEV